MNRILILRSSTAGARPVGRDTGELYVNLPDNQLGVIDDTNAPVDLIAVRHFSAAASYFTGDCVLYNGRIYIATGIFGPGTFNPLDWNVVTMATDLALYMPLSGGTFTGVVRFPANNSVVINGAVATQRAILGQTAGSNRWQLMLGDFTAESGLNAGSNFSLSAMTDGGATLSTPLAINRATGVADFAVTPTVAGVPIGGGAGGGGGVGENLIINGNFAINQRAYVSGTALPAVPTIMNGYGHDRWKAGAGGCTYTFAAVIPDTTVTITAGTLTQIIEAGVIDGGPYTLSWAGTAQARVYQGAPTGAYAASPLTTPALTPGVNTIVEFNTGTVTRVKFESGAAATPFNRLSMARCMTECQRYYQIGTLYCDGLYAANAGNAIYFSNTCPVPPRTGATATMTIVRNTSTNLGATPSLNHDPPPGNMFYVNASATAVGTARVNIRYSANAEL
jgi:hypothetical protein